MDADILFGEKDGLIAVAVNPEGRLAALAQSHADIQKAWVFGQTPVPEINLLFSGTTTAGLSFLDTMKQRGITVDAGPVYVPFGNPDKYDHDPNLMLREESCLCRGDGPSAYPRLLRHLLSLIHGEGQQEWR